MDERHVMGRTNRRMKWIAAVVGALLLSAAIILLVFLPLAGRRMKGGTVDLRTVDLTLADEETAAAVKAAMSDEQFAALIVSKALARDGDCGFDTDGIEVRCVSDGAYVSLGFAYTPWRRRRYSLRELALILDDDSVTRRRNSALERGYRDAIEAVLAREAPGGVVRGP